MLPMTGIPFMNTWEGVCLWPWTTPWTVPTGNEFSKFVISSSSAHGV